MQIGLFSDVHGDLKALQRVWRALEASGLTSSTVINAGDNVGYGDAPEECVAFMRDRPQIVCVLGNYDKNVAAFPEEKERFRRKWGATRPEKYRAICEDSHAISPASRDWLAALPRQARVAAVGRSILVTHYAPNAKIGLTPSTPADEFDRLAGDAGADVVVCGHTHIPFTRRAAGVLFVNPGAVGRGRLGEASYGVLTIHEGTEPSARVFAV
ncbi:MAG: metallophosphoesterase family protein [Capsulimonadaceae bacterium]